MKILENLIARYGEGGPFAHGVATIYMGLGDYEKAFEWLEKSYQDYDYDLMKLQVDPVFRPLHTDSRFRPLVEKILNSRVEPDSGPEALRFAIVDRLYEKSKLVSVDPDIFDAYVGKYKHSAGDIYINKIGEHLMVQFPSNPTRSILYPLSETSFCLKNNNYIYSFDKNEQGQVTEFSSENASIPGSKTRWPKISDEVPAIPERIGIDIDPASFHDYVGNYQISNGSIVTLSMENNRLICKWSVFFKEELLPLSQISFFLELAGPRVTFLRDAQGLFSQIVLTMEGEKVIAEKIEF